jgi:transposase
MGRQAYPDDITDKEWELIRPFLEQNDSPKGRKAKYPKREVMNAIFYLIRSGCSWRHLPHDFPPWYAVYTQFSRWRNRGVFENMHDKTKAIIREFLGRNGKASGAIIDSQSVKTVEKGGSVDMTAGRKLKAEKDISQWTRKGSCYRRMLRAQQ